METLKRKPGRPRNLPSANPPLGRLERRRLADAQFEADFEEFKRVRMPRMELRLELSQVFKYEPLTLRQRQSKIVSLEREINLLTRVKEALEQEYDELARQAAEAQAAAKQASQPRAITAPARFD